MDYTIVHGPNKAAVIADVKALLADGWTIQGGVSISFVDNTGLNRKSNVIFAQALKKIS